jgi:hypothetical protein
MDIEQRERDFIEATAREVQLARKHWIVFPEEATIEWVPVDERRAVPPVAFVHVPVIINMREKVIRVPITRKMFSDFIDTYGTGSAGVGW